MRKFPYPTVQTILDELAAENFPISRPTFYNLEKAGVFLTKRTKGQWRTFTRQEIDDIKAAIKENYGQVQDPRKRTLWNILRGPETNGNR